MRTRKIVFKIEVVTPEQVSPAVRARIETFTRLRDLEYGKFLVKRAEQIRKERESKNEKPD